MARFPKPLIFLLLGTGVCCVLILIVVQYFRTGHSSNAAKDIPQMTSESLEHEIRGKLPTGVPLAAVQTFLSKRGIEFSFEGATRTLYATARNLKGSTTFASKSLTLIFRFDDDLKLRFIDTKVLYTGL